MGYIIAYLLFAVVVDLLCELVNPEGDGHHSAVRRRLWSESEFDCYSKNFSPNMLRLDSFPKNNRLCLLAGKIKACPCKT